MLDGTKKLKNVTFMEKTVMEQINIWQIKKR